MTRRPKGFKGFGRAFCLALLACCALSALSAANASALEYKYTKGSEFSVGGGEQTFYSPHGNWTCSEVSGTGKVLSSTEIEVPLKFKKCVFVGFTCTTSGQEKGTIAFSPLRAKLVWIDKAHTKFGWLFHPEGGSSVIMEASCFGQLLRVRGSWIAQITQPALNVFSTHFTMTSASTGSKQEPQQVEGEGVNYHLESALNSGSYGEMAISGSAEAYLAGGAQGVFSP
jgi:hypothetical protein